MARLLEAYAIVVNRYDPGVGLTQAIEYMTLDAGRVGVSIGSIRRITVSSVGS